MSLIAIIIVGAIAGWLASAIMKTNTGIMVDIILGIVGALVGGLLSSLLFNVNLVGGINLTSILVALVGAIIVIAIYRAMRRGSV